MLRVNKQTISLDNPANDSFSVGNTTAATASGSIAGAVTGEKLSLIVDQSNTQNVVVTKQLAAQEAWIKDLKASSITTDNLVAKVAQIDSLTATDAIIKNIVAQTITTDNITAAVGNIKNLTSDSAIIDTIRNTIITSDFSDSVVAKMSNGVITSALIESLSADKIAAGQIYTDDVQIQSKDGCMVLKDSTMQISDGKQVRVQIGKDANDNYTIIIYDENGNVLWGEGGITENAIRDGLINDKMVDDNANINVKKINLPSLIKEINNGTETIKSSAINYDPTGQTLDVTFNRIESQLLDDLGYNLYYDSQTMKDGWSFVGNYSEAGEKQWDREYKHYECKIFRLSDSYSYIDSSFMPEDGKVYTLSAYIKGRAMVYYPVGLEVGDVYEFSEATRVKYDFTYDSKKGKPVFTPADDSGSIEIYAIKLEYGGAMTAYCLTADEEGREEKVQMSAFHVSSTNLKSEFYEKDKENKKKFSLISQTVDEIKTKVGVIDGDYITGSELKQTAKEINAKVSEIYQTKDGMNNYAKSSELSLKADKATLGNYQTIAGMSSYATTTWAKNQIDSKVSVGGVCSEINQSSEQITLNSNRLVVNSTNFTLDGNGIGSIGGWQFTNDCIYSKTNATFASSGTNYALGGWPYKIALWQGKLICGIQVGSEFTSGPPVTNSGYCDLSVAGFYSKDHKQSNGYLFAVDVLNSSVTTNTGAFTASDRRLKTNVNEIDEQYANDLIDDLKPSTYRMIDGKRTHSGFIADEVKRTAEKVLGTAENFAAYATVKIDEDKQEYAALRYEEFIAPLTKYCQCLKRDLKQEIEKNQQLQFQLLNLQGEFMILKQQILGGK